jgi:hypothetical protein
MGLCKIEMLLDLNEEIKPSDINALLDQVFKDNNHIAKLIICDSSLNEIEVKDEVLYPKINKAEELIQYFNNAYGIEREWPKTFEVSAELYGRCCQTIFDRENDKELAIKLIKLGPNRGLMFKNVELIIRR